MESGDEIAREIFSDWLGDQSSTFGMRMHRYYGSADEWGKCFCRIWRKGSSLRDKRILTSATIRILLAKLTNGTARIPDITQTTPESFTCFIWDG
jgi:hypothetical protein